MRHLLQKQLAHCMRMAAMGGQTDELCNFCGFAQGSCATYQEASSCFRFTAQMSTGKIGETLKGMTADVVARLNESDAVRKHDMHMRLVTLKNEIDDAMTALGRINGIVEQLLVSYTQPAK